MLFGSFDTMIIGLEDSMETIAPRYSKEEFARRGDESYEKLLRSHITHDDDGKYVLIDIETAEYEIDEDELAASERLLARNPTAQVWMRQIGTRGARRFGARAKTALL